MTLTKKLSTLSTCASETSGGETDQALWTGSPQHGEAPLVEYEPGCCEGAVPLLALQYSPHADSCVPTLVVMLNCCVPGFGTILASMLVERGGICFKGLLVGALQFSSTIIAVGILWSWWWAARICHKSEAHFKNEWLAKRRVNAELDKRNVLGTSEVKEAEELLYSTVQENYGVQRVTGISAAADEETSSLL